MSIKNTIPLFQIFKAMKSLLVKAIICAVFLGAIKSQSQCGPYQYYEGIDPSAMGASGWTMWGNGSWTFINNAPTVARSGQNYLKQIGTNTIQPLYIKSPKINTPKTFSFWVKNSSSVVTYSLSLSDDNSNTWVPINNGITSLSTTLNPTPYSVTAAVVPVANSSAWQLVTVTAAFPYSSNGYYFKIADTRVNSAVGTLFLDDISWSSSVASENTIIVSEVNSISSSPSNCNVIIPSTGVYHFYDVGGKTDYYSNGQINNVIFTPANPAEKIKITFNSLNMLNAGDYLDVYDNNTIGTTPIPGSPFTGIMPTTSYISSLSTDGSIAVRFYSDGTYASGYNSISDGYDITVECSPPVCPNPITTTINTIASSTARMYWTGISPGYEYAVTTTNVPPSGSGTYTTATSITLTGLTPDTFYYGWVRGKCGTNFYSNWVMTTGFMTLCATALVPYIENFNGLNFDLPPCTSITGGSWYTDINNGNLIGATPGKFFFTKPIVLSASILYRLSYDYSSILGTTDFDIYIGTVNDDTMLSPANKIFSHTGVNTMTNNALNFSIGVYDKYYIGFYIVSNSNPSVTQLKLDNILIEFETCKPPSSVAGSLPTTNSGKISWSPPAPAPANGYQYYVSTSNTPPLSSVTPSGSVAAGVTNVVISGLTSNTQYYVWVRSNCGSYFSMWSTAPGTLLTSSSSSSTIVMQTGNNLPGNCDVAFFDSAGATSNYSNNESYTYTFYPTGGSKLKAVFSSFSTEANLDGLMIYNGTSAIPANLISSGKSVGINAITCPAGAFSGTNSPGTIYSTDASGALTFVFKSDAVFNYSGWSAALSCVTPPTISSFSPTDNSCGVGTTTVTITGTNFVSPPVTGVFFSGVPATSFTVVNSSTLTAVVPLLGVVTGAISVANAGAIVNSSTVFAINAVKPITTGVSICAGDSASLTATSICGGYINSGTTISGNWNGATDPIIKRVKSMSNATACAFETSITRNYVATPFQVSVSGPYSFEMSSVPAVDGMGYIVKTPFTSGVCSANWVVGDDDSGSGIYPLLSANLTAGVNYVLYSTTWSSASGVNTGAFTWSVSTPLGGQIMLAGSPNVNWYTVASGGTPIASGSTFNPVGVSGSGLTNTNTPSTQTYYAACSANATCRAATDFVINVTPNPVITASATTVCVLNTIVSLTATGSSNNTWSTSAGSLYTDPAATIPYVALSNVAIVYLKSNVNALITLTGTNGLCVRTTTQNILFKTTKWNGTTWDNGIPDSSTQVVFNGNYASDNLVSPGDLNACSVIISSGTVLFKSGHSLIVQNGVSTSGGTLTFEDNSSLVQVANVTNGVGVYSGGNVGSITYKRNTTPIRKFDFTYWSTPVNPQTLLAVSPLTFSDRFMSYNSTTNSWTILNSSSSMVPGKGYIIRAPQTFDAVVPQIFNASFNGVPNNGTITTPIVGPNNLNLIGNPYPSALNADLFMSNALNSGIVDATIYLWTHNTAITANNYSTSDYAVYNYLGGTGTAAAPSGSTGGFNNNVPNGKIAAGQSFFIKGLASGNATFLNSMRVVGNNNQFFKSSSAVSSQNIDNRIWLDIKNEQGDYKQILIGYSAKATMDIDRGYDSECINTGTQGALYSIVKNTCLSIQGRSLPFEDTDEVPLGFTTSIPGSYTINLYDFDGLFLRQDVYLKDNKLNKTINLKEGSYSFLSNSGVFNDRFVLQYKNSMLAVANTNFTANDVVLFKPNQDLHIDTGSTVMKQVRVFDLLGRLVSEKTTINANQAVLNLGSVNKVFLIEITSSEGVVVTKKYVN
jgi:hypothetical protein